MIPRAGSLIAHRLRPARAWMLALPVDFLAAAAPALWYTGFWRGTLSMAVLTVTIFAVGGFYQARRHLSFLDELPGLVGGLLAASAVVALASGWRHNSTLHVGQFMHSVAISGGLVLVGRLLSRQVVLLARRRRWVSHAAIVVGHGNVAAEIAGILQRYPQYGLRFAGFVDDLPPMTGYADTSWLGNLDELEEVVRYTETDVVIVADTTVEDDRLMEVVRRPASMKCDLLVVPRLHDAHTQVGRPDHIGAIPIMRIRRPALTGVRVLKRTLDILFAAAALAGLSPLLLACAIAVYLEGGPGIFFRQPRTGRFGRQFDVIKFRSMQPRHGADSATTRSIASDPRVGPVGRFMRRTSLDELPQLWNILRGDMTLVGPRPERRSVGVSIRVAVVSEPGKAGVKTHVVDLLRGLDLDRFDVTLYYSLGRSDHDYPDQVRDLAARGVRCVEIPIQADLSPWGDLRALAALVAELRRLRPRILHLHSSKAGGLGRLASLFLWPRPRVIYTPHGMACYRSRRYLWLERLLGPLTHVPVAVSPSEKSDFIAWRIPRARTARVLTMGVRPPSRTGPPISGDRETYYVGGCGRICYQKNAHLFFDLAIRMAGEGKYRFRWIGEFGDDAEAAQVRVMLDRAGWPPEIEITGWLSRPEEQLRTLDVFCMLSRYESFGYATAEAMALGVPVVATATTGTVDLVHHEQTGLLVDSNLVSVEAAVRRVASDPALRERLRIQGRRLVGENYTVGRMVDDVEQIYHNAARSAAWA